MRLTQPREAASVTVNSRLEDQTMFRFIRLVIASPLALFVVSASAGAQDGPSMVGLSVGAHGVATLYATSDAPSGHGLVLALRYGVSERLSVQAFTSGTRVSASGDQDAHFQRFVDAEARYYVGRASGAWRPHVAVGVSARNVHNEPADDEIGGTTVRMTIGPTAGGGIGFLASRQLSVDAPVRYTFRDAQRTRALAGLSVPACPLIDCAHHLRCRPARAGTAGVASRQVAASHGLTE
jgi:hypothetical protein